MGVVLAIWSSDFAHEDMPVAHARRGKRCLEIVEGVDEILRKRKPHDGIAPYEFSVLKEV